MFGNFQNFYGGRTLALREIRRFLKVYHQTIISPIISALMFLSVFVLAIGDASSNIHGIPMINFMGYGLIMMVMVQNSFANTSSSLTMSKIIGYINDLLMPPLSPAEIIGAFCIGSIARAVTVGVLLALILAIFIDYDIHSLPLLIFFSLSAIILLSLIGIFAGMYAESFDQMAAITNYVVTPLSFLSGTFYSVQKLPVPLQEVNLVNPFFYMIDGFRYSLTGISDSNITAGVLILITANCLMFTLVYHLLNIGWRIKQ